jgi:hypothetical protein
MFKILKTHWFAVVIGLVLLPLFGNVALAAGAPQFKTTGNGAWVPHTGFNSQHGLFTSSISDLSAPYGVTAGGIRLLNGPTDPASITAASFMMKANVTHASGGSPRLVIVFSDGGNIQLRPLNWTADAWQLVDGFALNSNVGWDTNGVGDCPYLYNVAYSAVLSCLHPNRVITDIFVVNDSGWFGYLPNGEQITIDDITVNAIVAHGPGNSN